MAAMMAMRVDIWPARGVLCLPTGRRARLEATLHQQGKERDSPAAVPLVVNGSSGCPGTERYFAAGGEAFVELQQDGGLSVFLDSVAPLAALCAAAFQCCGVSLTRVVVEGCRQACAGGELPWCLFINRVPEFVDQ